MARISHEEFEKKTLQIMDIMVDMSEETFKETVQMFDNQEVDEVVRNFLDELVQIVENRRAEKKGVV